MISVSFSALKKKHKRNTERIPPVQQPSMFHLSHLQQLGCSFIINWVCQDMWMKFQSCWNIDRTSYITKNLNFKSKVSSFHSYPKSILLITINQMLNRLSQRAIKIITGVEGIEKKKKTTTVYQKIIRKEKIFFCCLSVYNFLLNILLIDWSIMCPKVAPSNPIAFSPWWTIPNDILITTVSL